MARPRKTEPWPQLRLTTCRKATKVAWPNSNSDLCLASKVEVCKGWLGLALVKRPDLEN